MAPEMAPEMAELTELRPVPDVASMAAGLGIALHTAGLPVGPDRCERLARAVTVMGATSLAELRACALATMVSDPGQMAIFDRVFAAVFGGPSPVRNLSPPAAPPAYRRPDSDGGPQPVSPTQGQPPGLPSGLRISDVHPASADGDEPQAEGPAIHRVASATERLRGREFTELSPAELRQLVTLMREMSLAIPPRRTRRYRSARAGKRPDLRRAPRIKRRRLVVLCDISGSMEPYARALLMLLYVLNGGGQPGGQTVGQSR